MQSPISPKRCLAVFLLPWVLTAANAYADQIMGAATSSDVLGEGTLEVDFVPGMIRVKSYVFDVEAGGFVEMNGGSGITGRLKANLPLRIWNGTPSVDEGSSFVSSVLMIDPAIAVSGNYDPERKNWPRHSVQLGQLSLVYLNAQSYKEGAERRLPYNTFDFRLATASYRNDAVSATGASVNGLDVGMLNTSFHAVGQLKNTDVVLGICGSVRLRTVIGEVRYADQTREDSVGVDGEVCVEMKVGNFAQIRNVFGLEFLTAATGPLSTNLRLRNRTELAIGPAHAAIPTVNYEFTHDSSVTDGGPQRSLDTHYVTLDWAF